MGMDEFPMDDDDDEDDDDSDELLEILAID
jgi:hypothetical protein